MKLPAFQFYPGDWRKDPGIQSLTLEQRGAWLEMMCLMHESERRGYLMLNGKPFPEDSLARLLGLQEEDLLNQNSTKGISYLLTLLVDRGVASRDQETGVIYCRRMVRDEQLRKTRAECGKQGGNPLLLKQTRTTGVKQKLTPSSSSSSSVSSSETNLSLFPQITADQVYEEYPRKEERPAAIAEINKAAERIDKAGIPKGHVSAMAYLHERTLAYSHVTAQWPEDERRFIPQPRRWYRNERYNDDPKIWQRGSSRPNHATSEQVRRFNGEEA
jgi:hypothetical protein